MAFGEARGVLVQALGEGCGRFSSGRARGRGRRGSRGKGAVVEVTTGGQGWAAQPLTPPPGPPKPLLVQPEVRGQLGTPLMALVVGWAPRPPGLVVGWGPPRGLGRWAPHWLAVGGAALGVHLVVLRGGGARC